MIRRHFTAAVLLAALGVVSLRAGEKPVRIAAAASLTEAVTEAAQAFEKKTGTPVVPVFAGSMTLARQIDSGAPVDLFFSADEESVAFLRKNGKILESRPLLSNRLAVVVSHRSKLSVLSAADLDKFSRLAIGEPASVPVGRYTREWLTGQKLWESLQPRCVGFDNVRAALAAVESGQLEAGIVYATDARDRRRCRLAYLVPADQSPAILYPLARLQGRDSAETRAFADFLAGKEAMEIFRRFGFSPAPQPTPAAP